MGLSLPSNLPVDFLLSLEESSSAPPSILVVPALFPDSLDKSFLDFFPRSPPSSSLFSFSVDAFLVESVLPAISVDESSSDPDFCSFSPVYGSPLLPGSELPPLTGAAGVIFGSAGTSEDLSSARPEVVWIQEMWWNLWERELFIWVL